MRYIKLLCSSFRTVFPSFCKRHRVDIKLVRKNEYTVKKKITDENEINFLMIKTGLDSKITNFVILSYHKFAVYFSILISLKVFLNKIKERFYLSSNSSNSWCFLVYFCIIPSDIIFLFFSGSLDGNLRKWNTSL